MHYRNGSTGLDLYVFSSNDAAELFSLASWLSDGFSSIYPYPLPHGWPALDNEGQILRFCNAIHICAGRGDLIAFRIQDCAAAHDVELMSRSPGGYLVRGRSEFAQLATAAWQAVKAARSQPADIDASTAVASDGAASSSRSSSNARAAATGPSTRSVENRVDSGAPQASRPTVSATPSATLRQNASSNDLRATIKAALDATATYSMYQGRGRDGRCLDTTGFLRDSCFDIDGSGALCAPQEGLSIAEQSRIGQASMPRVLTGSEAALSNLAKFGQPLPQPGYADAGLDLRQARALAETVLSGS